MKKSVSYVGATRVYPGNPVPAVNALDLEVEPGELIVLVGPSGSGKSTALRMVAGLEDVDAGEIRVGGEDISYTPPKNRNVAMVFQNYALYPHMSVGENMGFALKLRGINRAERDEKVRQAAKMLELDGLLDRKPKALSGGQRQRVAMGRAIVREPSVFLMDEPLSNLDAMLRVETRANIAALQSRLGTTTIYVTHDQVEAMTMGHRVAVLKDGILQQVDTPRTLYERPANLFVAGFIGSPAMNLRRAHLVEAGARLAGTTLPLPRTVVDGTGGRDIVVLGLRPESFVITDDRAAIPLRVEFVEELGADAFVYGSLPGDTPQRDRAFVVRIEGRTDVGPGDTLHVAPLVRDLHVFHPETGERLH
jgi:multiple sugar transport system ATP-binding protein